MKVFFNNDFYVGAAKYFPLKKAYGENYKILATGASGAGYHQKDALLDKDMIILLAQGFVVITLIKLFLFIYKLNTNISAKQGKVEKDIIENSAEMIKRSSTVTRLKSWLQSVKDNDHTVPGVDAIVDSIGKLRKEEQDGNARADSQVISLVHLGCDMTKVTGDSGYCDPYFITPKFADLTLPEVTDLSTWFNKNESNITQQRNTSDSRLQPLLAVIQASNSIIKRTLGLIRDTRNRFYRF